jgi:hypothetical protein
MDDAGPRATRLLENEARGLLTRLDQVKPFALHETMVPAAAPPYEALQRIERFLVDGRRELRARVRDYLSWLRGPGRGVDPAEQQHRFVLIRMSFNDVLAQFDLFTEVITQRSEHGTGIWLSGLDVLARDALAVDLPGRTDPPAVCYLARGPGAAIRRANTRLPGGRPNPVAIIRIPRERMVGSGIASSLVHEVGHQAAAQLGLVESLRADIARAQRADTSGVWPVWGSWISEIVADLWSVGTLGVTSTVGLLAVVSLPSFFVFRPAPTDPHPTPYLRVLISASVGDALHPHPQWAALRETWKRLYPVKDLPPARRAELARIESGIPRLVQLLVAHHPPALHGRRLGQLWPAGGRGPDRLLALYREWAGDLAVLARQRPSLVFAAIGQARAAGVLTPEAEGALLSQLLQVWAVRSSLDVIPRPIHKTPATRRAS